MLTGHLKWPFLFNLAIFMAGIFYTIYLDKYYTKDDKDIPLHHKVVFLIFAATLLVIYLGQFYYITTQTVYGSVKKDKFIDWILQMFVGNLLAFALIYFALSLLVPNQFYDVEGKINTGSLLTRYIEMLYFSVSTFFTIGFGDIVALQNTSRIINMIQILTAYVVQTYLYADILLGN